MTNHQVREDVEGAFLPLVRFIEALRDDDGCFGSVDGGDLQILGVECGLLEAVEVEDACWEECQCARTGNIPGTCYRWTAAYRRLRALLPEEARRG